MKNEFEKLAERCEQASGPDLNLDCAIWKALGQIGDIDYYTASLDAAMALLPSEWKLRQMHFNAPCADDRKWHLNLYGGKQGEDTFVGRGSTPSLALTAAALRAHSYSFGDM